MSAESLLGPEGHDNTDDETTEHFTQLVDIQEHYNNLSKITHERVADLQLQMFKTQEDKFKKCVEVEMDIQKEVEHINADHTPASQRLASENPAIKKKILSINYLDRTISEIDKQISDARTQYESILFDLDTKKSELKSKLISLEKIELVINYIDGLITQTEQKYKKEMEDVNEELNELHNTTDMLVPDITRKIGFLKDKEIKMKSIYDSSIDRLTAEKYILMKEAGLKIITKTKDYFEQKNKCLEELENLEQQLLQKELYDSIAIKREILKKQRELEICEKKFKKFQELNDLSETQIELAMNGVYNDKYGNRISIQDQEFKGFPPLPSRATTAQSDSTKSHVSGAENKYLQECLGRPLTLAISEVLAKRPTDPIHFIAHWLLKYRYNQEITEVKKRELDELLAERHRIQEEIRLQQVELEAYRAILDMIMTAETEADRRMYEKYVEELENIEQELEAETFNEENVEEAVVKTEPEDVD